MEQQGGAKHRATVMEVLRAALTAVDPYNAVLDTLRSQPQLIPQDINNLYVLGAGKAGAAMALAAEDVLGDRITRGLVVVKDGHTLHGQGTPRRIELAEASHPVPDTRGVDTTRRVQAIAGAAREGDFVLCLISGGGSALLVSPVEGVGLQDVQTTTGLLLRAGATINELNAVRKHLSTISGGQLARRAYPARVLALILSDVTGSPLDVIASGPTAPDPTTYADALQVLEHYGVIDQVPAPVAERLRRGASGELPETPKPGDAVFSSVCNIVVASNVSAVEAAAARARQLGFNTIIMSTFVEGEAAEVGKVLAGVAKEIAAYDRPVPRPACLLFGGETTVTVRGGGTGGRNTELALAAARALAGLGPDLVVASFATDGGDGTSPSAGAIADGTSIDRGKALGLDAARFLTDNDSYTYWAKLGDAIMTGPTGTNVNDVMAVFVF